MNPEVQAVKNPEDLLNLRIVRDYSPNIYSQIAPGITGYNRPVFTLSNVPVMLSDPRITYGMLQILGPLLGEASFVVESSSPEVAAFVEKQLWRFWNYGAAELVSGISWGFSGGEVYYREYESQLQFDRVRTFYALDMRAVTRQGCLVGFTLNNSFLSNQNKAAAKKVFVGIPKGIWYVHQPHYNPWYGRSQLYGSYLPWIETWRNGGYLDVRSLFYYKYAYRGQYMYYPPTGTVRGENSEQWTPQQLARDILEKLATGHTCALPGTRSADGQREWEIVDPQVQPPLVGVLEYGSALEREMLLGMGVNPEVSANDSGGGYAGRRIPQQAFYAMLHLIASAAVNTFVEQVLDSLVKINYGDVPYQVTVAGLLRDEVGDPLATEPDEELYGDSETEEPLGNAEGTGSEGTGGNGDVLPPAEKTPAPASLASNARRRKPRVGSRVRNPAARAPQ